jgi:enterochelin esterase-like enzyme
MMTSHLQIQGLPTLVFVGVDASKPALRAEGLLPAASIKEIIQSELLPQVQAASAE